jgi:hypothetical protein
MMAESIVYMEYIFDMNMYRGGGAQFMGHANRIVDIRNSRRGYPQCTLNVNFAPQ